MPDKIQLFEGVNAQEQNCRRLYGNPGETFGIERGIAEENEKLRQ